MAAKKKDSLSVQDKLKAALLSEAEQPYQIPKNWVWTRLGFVALINPTKKPIADLDPYMVVTFVPMTAVDDVSGEITAAQQRSLINVRTGYTQFADGDVIFAKITPCMENGKTAIVRETISGIAYGSTEFYVLRPFGVNAVLLYFYLRARSFRNDAKQVMTGAVGQQRVPKAWLEQHPLPFPPLLEQRRIAKKLESLLRKVKDAKAFLDEIPEILRNFRQSVLSAACSGKLTEDWRAINGEQPWATILLGDLVDSSANGFSKRRGASGKETVVLRLADFKDATRIRGNERKINLTEKEIGRYRLNEGDLLIVRVNGSREIAGKFIVYKGKNDAIETYCDHFIRLKVTRDKLDPVYARYVGNSVDGRKYIEAVLVTSAGQNTINQSSLFRLSVPLPPLPEQQEIVRRVESLFSKADEIEVQYKEAMELIETLPEIILSKAFRGKLVPQDKNDEPAMELLKRIVADTVVEVPEKVACRRKRARRQNL